MPLCPAYITVDDDAAMLIGAAREFSRDNLLAKDRGWDHDESSAYEVVPQLAEMGFLGLLVPQDKGGMQCSYRTYAAILHELSYFSPSTCVTVSVHSMVAHVLDCHAREPKRSEWLSQWGQADHLGAFALSEAGAGSDTAAIQTTARQAAGGFLLNGEKMWVTNGMNARWFLVLARIGEPGSDAEPTAFLLDGNTTGMDRSKITGKMGIRGSETAVISLHDVFVPLDYQLGDVGEGRGVFLAGLNGGRVGIAAQATGISEACLDEMASYAQQREQFGQPIGRFPAVANMIADSRVELEAARLLVWRAAAAMDAGRQNRAASSMAKAYASEAANRIAYRAVQVHGGSGFVNECRVEQLYRDARITTIYEGTSETQRIVIARELMRRV